MTIHKADTDRLDVLRGASSIARYIGIKSKRVYHLSRNSNLPIFREGGCLCARKSTLEKWIREQELKP